MKKHTIKGKLTFLFLILLLTFSMLFAAGCQKFTKSTDDAKEEFPSASESSSAKENAAPADTAAPDAAQLKVGTWKTAQTIQPFFYDQFIDKSSGIEVLPFTNPGDQKTALLSGGLDMTGTTLVTAITAASNNEPVRIVTSLCNKCSALVAGVN